MPLNLSMSVSGVDREAAPQAGSCEADAILNVDCTAAALGSPGTIWLATRFPYVLSMLARLVAKVSVDTPSSASWRRRAAPDPAGEAAPIATADESNVLSTPLRELGGIGTLDEAAAARIEADTCWEVATAEAEISFGLAVIAARLDTQFLTFSGLAGSDEVRLARLFISWLLTACSWTS